MLTPALMHRTGPARRIRAARHARHGHEPARRRIARTSHCASAASSTAILLLIESSSTRWRAGVVYRDSNVTVTAFRVLHGSWKYAFGYRFDAGDRSIVVSGDTKPTDAVVDACHGCDVLVHEVYSKKGFDRLPADRHTTRRFTRRVWSWAIWRPARGRNWSCSRTFSFSGRAWRGFSTR